MVPVAVLVTVNVPVSLMPIVPPVIATEFVQVWSVPVVAHCAQASGAGQDNVSASAPTNAGSARLDAPFSSRARIEPRPERRTMYFESMLFIPNS